MTDVPMAGPDDGRQASRVGSAGRATELEQLRAASRRQAHVIEMLSDAVSNLRSDGEDAPDRPAPRITSQTAQRTIGRRQNGASHDAERSADSAPIDAAVALATVARDHQRLAAQAEAALRETERSRARLVTAAAQERRRIERELHDGAQERLTALRIGLSLAQETALSDPQHCAARLYDLGCELDAALEELSSLTHAICPPLLADRGLADAVTSAAEHSVVAVELHTTGVERYPAEVEDSVYFCILAALQDVGKHARGVQRAQIQLDGRQPGTLRFQVRDDGGGGATQETLQREAGITSMRDRIQAVGGELHVTLEPGTGTLIQGSVPIPSAHSR